MSCKTLKTKWGQEIDISQFENQGYGAFKDFVKNTLDSSWGKEKDAKAFALLKNQEVQGE